MWHEASASLDELVTPEALSRVTGVAVTSVRRLPFVGASSASGSRFLAIETNKGQGPRFVLKRVSCEWDWIMRATDDRRGREAMVWRSGLLDRLPPETTHPVVACARDGAGWAILMRDVGAAVPLVGDPYVGVPISRTEHARYLNGLAALHAAFWEEPTVVEPSLGFCSPWHRYAAFSPETGRREGDGPDAYPRIVRDGWELLPGLIEPAVADLLAGLANDPGPLCAALARYPQTVVHGDPRPPNLGQLGSDGSRPRVVLLDWHFVGTGVPGVDLGWYLYCAGVRPREPAIEWYRRCLARRLGPRFDEGWWRPQLALSLLGNLVRIGSDVAWATVRHERPAIRERAREDLAWWADRAKEATRWL